LDERANDLGLTEEERKEQLDQLNVMGMNTDQDQQYYN